MVIVGKVKWFDPNRGFGFIEHGGKGKDVFVHFSAIQNITGYRALHDGQHVCYQIVRGKNGPMAINVTPLSFIRA
ncbi:cold-shock protein [uncultured Phascolarctobacterium sp.]|mgnify:CR=1 FL=1|uniref:cold-shock protein n=1 Tax=uncultured Phascolarctobacterium sp. TaxID=512296 RepID=UPI0025E71797|nr:cold-shock protein [uncultured Phascolarctobacterium sp.]